jgi:hypothetical protein
MFTSDVGLGGLDRLERNLADAVAFDQHRGTALQLVLVRIEQLGILEQNLTHESPV